MLVRLKAFGSSLNFEFTSTPTLIQEVHRREQEIVEKNQDLVEMKRKNQMVSMISLRIHTMMMRMVMMSMTY